MCIRRPIGEVGVYDPKNPLNPIRKYHPTTPLQPQNFSPRLPREQALPKMSMPMYPSLMALQAGLPQPDFSVMAGRGKVSYIGSIQAGIAKHYVPMESLCGEVIEKSRASS